LKALIIKLPAQEYCFSYFQSKCLRKHYQIYWINLRDLYWFHLLNQLENQCLRLNRIFEAEIHSSNIFYTFTSYASRGFGYLYCFLDQKLSCMNLDDSFLFSFDLPVNEIDFLSILKIQLVASVKLYLLSIFFNNWTSFVGFLFQLSFLCFTDFLHRNFCSTNLRNLWKIFYQIFKFLFCCQYFSKDCFFMDLFFSSEPIYTIWKYLYFS